MNIGYDGLWRLKVGEELEYKAGQGDHRVEASVTVARSPGTTGVSVTIGTIHHRGSKAEVSEGEEIIAGVRELFR